MRLKNEQKIEKVDRETGDIETIVVSKEYSTKISPDKFYMTFIEYIAPMFKLKSTSARTLLTWLCCHAEYNTGIIRLTTSERNNIVKELGMSNNTITNNLAILKKLKIISGEKGNFQINPQIFWKGDTKTRNELLNDRELKIKFCIE